MAKDEVNREKWNKHQSRDPEFWDPDSSYETWSKIFLEVYSRIPVFKYNFDFEKPRRYRNRLYIQAKDGSDLAGYCGEEIEKRIADKRHQVKTSPLLEIAGDTDFNFKGKGIEYHRFDNYSLMLRTGSLNNEKGFIYRDRFSDFIRAFPDIIKNPRIFRADSLRKKRAICARTAYYKLFKNDINQYCYDVYFYGIRDFTAAGELIDDIRNGKYGPENEKELAEKFWTLRRKILKDKYKIILTDNGQFPEKTNT